MRKKNRIKKNEEFQQILNEGKSFANWQLVIYYIKNDKQDHFRAGISVGKRIGNAVTRNRIKRYLRQCFLDYEHRIDRSVNMIVIARKPTKDMNFHEIKKSFTHLLKKQHLIQ